MNGRLTRGTETISLIIYGGFIMGIFFERQWILPDNKSKFKK